MIVVDYGALSASSPSRIDTPSRPDAPSGVDAPNRVDARRKDDDHASRDQDETQRTARARPEFAAMFALLVANESARAEAARRVKAGTDTFLDRMLNDAPAIAGDTSTVGDASMNALTGDTPSATSSLATSSLATSSLAMSQILEQLAAATRDDRSSTTGSDALRYGLMSAGARNSFGANGTTPDLGASRAEARYIARAVMNDAAGIGASLNTDPGSTNDNNPLPLASSSRTTARVAGTRGVRSQDLRAFGSALGAKVLDAVDSMIANHAAEEGAQSGGAAASLAAANMVATNLAALNSALAKSAADVTMPVRDTAALAPELRARLDRVVARMQDEYGSTVSVIETARSQQRQDALYAQGRTQPGNIVTWTKDSAHTRGDAVDVIVDGSFNNAEGFARLQRIAREEGLRTLGLKDPGHLELPRDGRLTDIAANTARTLEARSSNVAAAPMGNSVPSVASVANVASVAAVATIGNAARNAAGAGGINANTSNAGPGSSITQPDRRAALMSRNGAALDPSSVVNDGLVGAPDSSATKTRNDQNNTDSRGQRDERDPQQSAADTAGTVKKRAAYGTGTDAPPGVAALDSNARVGLHEHTPAAAATSGAELSATERVADLRQLQADAPAGSLSRMTLNVDGPNGPQRITVDLRGNVVDTQISTDTQSADRLRLHTGELQEALGRHGLETDSVRISGTTREPLNVRATLGDRDGIVMTQTTGAQSGGNTPSFEQSQRDRALAREWERNEDARKSRDEQKQNAGQRGQRGTSNPDAR